MAPTAPLIGKQVHGTYRSLPLLKAMIGDYSGVILNCDQAKMYFDGKRLQW